jgi:hypothetical protein
MEFRISRASGEPIYTEGVFLKTFEYNSKKQFVEFVININSLEDLQRLYEKFGKRLIISFGEHKIITIYDDYME